VTKAFPDISGYFQKATGSDAGRIHSISLKSLCIFEGIYYLKIPQGFVSRSFQIPLKTYIALVTLKIGFASKLSAREADFKSHQGQRSRKMYL
jgi:hypothetical protein